MNFTGQKNVFAMREQALCGYQVFKIFLINIRAKNISFTQIQEDLLFTALLKPRGLPQEARMYFFHNFKHF